MRANASKIGLALGAALVCSCASMGHANWSEVTVPEEPPELEYAKEAATHAIGDQLKDPDAMKVRTWSPFFKMLESYSPLASKRGVWAICAEVNAKNSFGAYTGYRWWFVKFNRGKPQQQYGVAEDAGYECAQARRSDRIYKAPESSAPAESSP